MVSKNLPPQPQSPVAELALDRNIDSLIDLVNQNRYAEAELLARSITESLPDYGFGWKALGVVLNRLGRSADALGPMQRAVALLPGDAEAHNNLGIALRALGLLQECAASCRRALEINPNFAEAHINLGAALKQLGRLDEAEACCRRALEIKPNSAEAHNILGVVFKDLDRPQEAEASYRRALEITPNFVEVHNNLGIALKELGRVAEAEASYRRALEIKPDFAEAHNNLGNALQDQGRCDEAIASFRNALHCKPSYAGAYSNLLFLHGYHAALDAPTYLALARGWEEACVSASERQAARDRVFQRTPLAGRRLRVGYVSGDYRQHAVSYFSEQLFIHHDRARIELFAYSAHGQRDEITERLESLAEHWLSVAGLSETAIRERIEGDHIDVLVDLSGHTGHNRLGVFARRAAPVQIHYLGFFASTGLTEMDYWIGDDILTPAATGSHFSERVWRLPRTWVSYAGRPEAPLPGWRPAADGTVWVGSFNNLNKLTPATLATWARVLRALPAGRLLLKTRLLADACNRERILAALHAHGVAAERVELHDGGTTTAWTSHMACYDRLDIALDPVGAVGGGTTTCDALWMGVPLVTLAGDRMASRMTASMLHAVGHAEWIAQSEAEYVDKIVALARNVDLRKNLRATQRNRIAQSALCDVHGLAGNLENAYFEMFQRWLDGKQGRKNAR